MNKTIRPSGAISKEFSRKMLIPADYGFVAREMPRVIGLQAVLYSALNTSVL
jgi:hypothetical protein